MVQKPKTTTPIPYAAGQPENWETAVGDFSYDRKTGCLSGACPRCNHPFNDDLSDQVGMSLGPARLAPANPPGTIDYPWGCVCVIAHPGAPAGVEGCGANGTVRLKFITGPDSEVYVEAGDEPEPAEVEIEAGPPIDNRKRQIKKWADDAVANRLTNIRTSAQHWQTTISTVIGLFGSVTILATDKDTATLKGNGAYWYGGFVVAALIAAAVALHNAAKAGEGVEVTIEADMTRQAAEYQRVVMSASNHLSKSRTVTWIAVALLLIANGVRWYAPKNPSPPPTTAAAPAAPS